MFTECPTCNTVFRVQPEHLAAARGKVRCGECLAVFDAREYLRDDLEDPQEPTAPLEEAVEDQATLPLDLSPEEEVATAPARARSSSSGRDEGPAHPEWITATPTQPFDPLLGRAAEPSRHLPLWIAVNGALLILLAGQYLWFQRTELNTVPAVRPLYEALCGPSACAPASAAEHFTLTSRAVQSHPAYAQALLIDATFVNSSETPRPHPGLELVFTDPEGNALASRRFLPSEYLGEAPQRPLAPGAEAHVVLELLDPGDLAVGYEFHFF